MSAKTRIAVSARFLGQFEPDELTARLGVTPTETRASGGGRPARWRLQLRFVDANELAPLLDDLRSQFASARCTLAEAGEPWGLTPLLAIGVEVTASDSPECVVPAEFVQWAAAQGAELDVDIYVV